MLLSLVKIKKRALLVFGIFLVFLSALVFRVAYWQIVRGEEMKTAAQEQQTGKTIVAASRGTIYDRNGKALAESATVNTLVCNPQDVQKSGDPNVIAEKLSVILEMDYDSIYKLLTKTNRYQVIKKRISVEESEQIKNLKDSSIDKDMAKKFTGVYFEEDSKRYYSYNIAPHVIGFTGYDNNGLQGIELTFDNELSGKLGNIKNIQTAGGTSIDELQYEDYEEALKGADVVMTIDETIQHYLEKGLETAVKDSQLKEGAAGIIMNPKTGEILAMATKPDFDLNSPYDVEKFENSAVQFEYMSKILGRNITQKDNLNLEGEDQDDEKNETATTSNNTSKSDTQNENNENSETSESTVDETTLTPEQKEELLQERIAALRNKMWRNKAISDAYEPGSTFKIITAAAALEEGVVDLNTPFNCVGYKQIGDHKIKCHNTNGHGPQTFLEGVQHSCNPVFMETGLKLGAEKFMEYFAAFGFTKKTGIELVGESGSIYYKDVKMSETDVATSAFGQGFNITPIQLVTAISAVVNGGNLMKPQIVKEIKNDRGVLKSYQPEVVSKVISEETSKTMREILESVVSSPDGTGKNAYIKGYRIGGKTGTSEKGDRTQNKRIASFVGFAPADDPEIVCLVMLDEPQEGSKYGGSIAAPLAGEIMEQVLEYLGVERQYTEDETAVKTKQIPDVRGLGIDDAQQDVKEAGFNVKVSGDGKTIVDQLPKPGMMMASNSTVILYTKEVSADNTVTVPDVTGLSIADAKERIKNAGLNFEIVGAGQSNSGGAYAFKQSIQPGTKVSPYTVVGVEFRHSASD